MHERLMGARIGPTLYLPTVPDNPFFLYKLSGQFVQTNPLVRNFLLALESDLTKQYAFSKVAEVCKFTVKAPTP